MNPIALLALLIFLFFLLGILGFILLSAYWILGWLHRKRPKALLICGCIGIAISMLPPLFFFLVGALGIGPVPS